MSGEPLVTFHIPECTYRQRGGCPGTRPGGAASRIPSWLYVYQRKSSLYLSWPTVGITKPKVEDFLPLVSNVSNGDFPPTQNSDRTD